MNLRIHFSDPLRAAALVVLMCVLVPPSFAGSGDVESLLDRTGEQVSKFLEVFSDVKCTERVQQEKLGEEGKTDLKEESTYDYLVILTNNGGELSLDESRLAVRAAKADKKNTPMLVSNGFATLFLIFHPYYAGSFRFTRLGDETVDGRQLEKIAFEHIHDTRSPGALFLRGREYPLELSGTAWIDPQSAVITRIETDVGNTMEDLGMKSLHSAVTYSPVSFREDKQVYWFPAEATVEVETPRQHWRNVHHFSDYKRFSVSTEEQVAKQ